MRRNQIATVVEVKGAPYEVGFQHGSSAKAKITRFLEIVYSRARQYQPALTNKQHVLKLADKFLPFAQDWAPDLVEELHGLSDGAGISFAEVFALNCYSEVTYSPIASSSTQLMGCTSFVVSGGALSPPSTGPIIGQNEDWGRADSEIFIILKIKPSQGPSILMTTPAGFIGYAGRNSQGIGLVQNGLAATDGRLGVPVAFVARRVLQQERIGDSVDAIVNSHRSLASNYLIAEESGEAFDIETTATDFDIFHVEDDIWTHSNYYFSSKLKALEEKTPSWESAGCNAFRAGRLKNIFRKNYGKINSDLTMDALRDHVNYPRSICRHPDPAKALDWETSASIVMPMSQSKTYVTIGNPCNNEFKPFDLG